MKKSETTLKYLKDRFKFDDKQEMPIELKIDRFHGLMGILKALKFKVGAEIGSGIGIYAKFMCGKLKLEKLYCVEPWMAYKGYIERPIEKWQYRADGSYEKAKNRLAPYDAVEFVRKYSYDFILRI